LTGVGKSANIEESDMEKMNETNPTDLVAYTGAESFRRFSRERA
jgi:hypothetical protein